MSGLFLRLAAQANGQRGTTLHSPASLPYHQVPERLEQPESAMGWPAASRDRTPGAEQLAFAPNRASESSQHENTWLSPPATNPASPLLELPLAPATISPPSVPNSKVAAVAPLPRLEQSGPQSASLLDVPPAVVSGSIATTNSLPLDAPYSSPPEQLGRPPQHFLPGAARDGSEPIEYLLGDDSRALPLPATLLSPRPVTGRPLTVSAAPTTAAAPSQQPDEVHIHIGRIEVTAVQESASSKRETRKGRAPLSLDDYLSKRKGDGR